MEAALTLLIGIARLMAERSTKQMETSTEQEKVVDVDELVRSCRLLEADHEPDGWPAIQMWQISALCKAIEESIPSLDILQTRLEQGAEIIYQDGQWILFDKDGECVCLGKTIRKMLMNLIFVDC